MNATDLAVGLGAAGVGFGIIWVVFGLIRQQRAAPVEMFKVESKSSVDSAGRLSLEELGRTWHIILGVDARAATNEVETAYHSRLAECDQIRFSSAQSALERRNAENRRAQINDAYEFIRGIRH